MIVLVDPNDSRAVRNKDNVLALYELMINRKKSEEGTAKFVSPAYIQHNPLIPDGPVALGQFFGKVTRAKTRRHNQLAFKKGRELPNSPNRILYSFFTSCQLT